MARHVTRDSRLSLLLLMSFACAGPASFAQQTDCFAELMPARPSNASVALSHYLKLESNAVGGELVLTEIWNANPRYIRIPTRAGESAEVVLARMAAAINSDNPFSPAQLRSALGWNVRAEGNLLKSFPGFPGEYLFAGTETGLGIPPPPTSLSVSYDQESQDVSLIWENPDDCYDAVKSNFGQAVDGNETKLLRRLPPPEYRASPRHSASRDLARGNLGLRRFFVVGCRGGVLSNAAVITLNYKDGSQEELDTHPFTGGIAPNWKAWSHGGDRAKLILEQGTRGEWKRFDREPRPPRKPEERSYFQLIRTRSPEAIGGVCRKFLGLKPGHRYRLWTRMNTFDMDNGRQDWSFSFHAAAHARGVTLTSEQMAGTAPLPDGSGGIPAGRIVAYGPGNTTWGQFVETATGSPAAPDITVPSGAEVITVWFRCTGVTSGLGFDWIKLQDVTQQ